MDASSAITQTAQAMAQILQVALVREFELQSKLLAVNAQMQVQQATDAVRGAAIDILV